MYMDYILKDVETRDHLYLVEDLLVGMARANAGGGQERINDDERLKPNSPVF
jgi:hypothetical protein